jgi:hypothetical protein
MANISFDLDLTYAIAKCADIPDALLSMHSLNSQEATYCTCALIYNLSIPEKADMKLRGRRDEVTLYAVKSMLLGSRRVGGKSSDGDKDSVVVVTILVGVIKSLVGTTATPMLCGQLAAAALCNFGLHRDFHEQLATLAMGPMISITTSPRCALDIKVDVVRFLYNIVTSDCYPAGRSLAIKSGVVGGILAVLKLMTAEDEATLGLLGTIVLELCGEVELINQILLEGISKALIRLGKVESPSLKLTVARALFRLSLTTESASKLVQLGDGIETLFWLTIYDCLGEFGPILSNVSRTLKNFAINSADCLQLTKEERLFSVYKVLSRSESEDVLWQTCASVFNILKVEEARQPMIKRGVVPLVFSLAVAGGSSGYISVRYLCSASLHSIPGADTLTIIAYFA